MRLIMLLIAALFVWGGVMKVVQTRVEPTESNRMGGVALRVTPAMLQHHLVPVDPIAVEKATLKALALHCITQAYPQLVGPQLWSVQKRAIPVSFQYGIGWSDDYMTQSDLAAIPPDLPKANECLSRLWEGSTHHFIQPTIGINENGRVGWKYGYENLP
jgi:hypothetical protein